MVDYPVRIVSPKVKKARLAQPQSELWRSGTKRFGKLAERSPCSK